MGRRRIFNFPKVPRRQQKSGTAPTGSGTNTISGLKYEDFNVYGIHGAGGESDSPPDGPDNLSFPTGPSQRNNAAENICPWELDDIGCTAKASSKADDNIKSGSVTSGHVRRGSDPTALISGKSCANTSSVTPNTVVQGGGGNVSKNPRLNPSATAVQNVATAVTAGTLDPQQPSSVAKGSSIASKRVATSSTSSDHDKSVSGANKSSPHEPSARSHRHSDTAAQSHHHHHHHHHHHAASR